MPREAMRLLLIGKESSRLVGLSAELSGLGFSCLLAKDKEAPALLEDRRFSAVLIEQDGRLREGFEDAREAARTKRVPIIGLIAPEKVETTDGDLEADDFFVLSGKVGELALRVRRLVEKSSPSNGVIHLGDVTIDPDRYEVTIAGRVIPLTYREYELLRFLAGSPGHVFTREALLDRVWGYDYFGGDRTVDVHIRRLRSKLGDSDSLAIETLRNIGYRLVVTE